MKEKIIIKTTLQDLFKSLKEAEINGNNMTLTLYTESEVNNEVNFKKLTEEYGVNMKDVRDIIKFSYSYWNAKRFDPWADDELIFRYHNKNKDQAQDKVYEEELILSTIKNLSNPSKNFYERLKSADPREFDVFEEYYKKINENETKE